MQFETIHSFLDGNGRLGRMLIPLILVDARILQEPLLYLSVFFKQHRVTYYRFLQQGRISGNWEAWLLFFADAIAATANQAVSTAQALTQLLAQDKARLAELVAWRGRPSTSSMRCLRTPS
ncbi:Fic family protein [Janthinobacterium svalbardensis]|uniref:Fic family protein n=1 Tax=Janthinobacterium svalbardensis TaxID=368607 RepID=UPI001ABFAFE8|nr:Fic family protein [Janthinobacterium svalbardensis]